MQESVDMLGELYNERTRYLLNTDELFEEIYGKSQIIDEIKMEFSHNAICCGTFIDIDDMAEMRTSEQLFVCGNNYKKFFKIAEF